MKKICLIFILFIGVICFFTQSIYAQSNDNLPELHSESAIVLEASSGKVLFEKNATKEMYPASLTKIATAIYAIEKGNMEDVVTVSEKARHIEGTTVYLEEGEQVRLKKLVQGLLINSGNDAAVAIAEHLSGSEKQFSSDLNEYLQNEVGVSHTNFENSSGLFNEKHVTTAADLANITQYAMNNSLFREIFGTKELKWVGESWDTTLLTHHLLLDEMPYEGITGGKTGFVNKSGFTLATTASRNNLNVIVITMKTNFKSEMYKDTTNLLDYVFDHFITSKIAAGTIFQIEDEEYKTTKDLEYTYSKEDQIQTEIKKGGILHIKNQDGDPITTFALERLKQEENEEAISTSEHTQSDKNGLESYTKIFFCFVLVIGVGFFAIRKIRKRKSKFKY
ncbi:D-alanyl-D-alanine carboxypeptidase family protein [Pseudogracilibacillus sp. SE30717A]|uniref:D-alanyl-D-alanine carboxypeptidase family protein n=1 Tax=Pseudogracilibacillus sp. SE30717A TaxID=3098293 RepID=UPI00300DC483